MGNYLIDAFIGLLIMRILGTLRIQGKLSDITSPMVKHVQAQQNGFGMPKCNKWDRDAPPPSDTIMVPRIEAFLCSKMAKFA